MKYFVGLLAIAVGVFMVLKTEWVLQMFGRSDWAEQHFGGSRFFYKVLGIVFIFVAMMGMTGLLGPLILNVFGRMFGIQN